MRCVLEIRSYSNMGPRVQSAPKGRSRTKQSFAEESEINNILARYVKTGTVDHLAQFGAHYGFASSVNFHEAMNIVTRADQMFGALPAEIRKRFVGDPAQFLEFVQNPENQEEMITLGLANRPEGVPVGGVVASPDAESASITPEVVADGGSPADAVSAA